MSPIGTRISVDDHNLPAQLTAAARRVEGDLGRLVVHYGSVLQTRVRKNASTGYHTPREGHIPGTGPGPNVATGDYRRSIALRAVGTLAVQVRTNAPQAWRLERGFVGMDSLGRMYHQRAYPHWEPAIAVTEPEFFAAVEALLARVTFDGSGTIGGIA